NEVNTDHYEIFRKDYSETVPIYTTDNPFDKTWEDDRVLLGTFYEYKVEAVGPWGLISTNGYRSITSYYCRAPGSFTLNNPTIYCQGPYPWADLSWTNSEHASSYNLNRYFHDGSIIETTTFFNVSSPFTDRGGGHALEFDGNDHVDCGEGESFDNLNELTMEFWAKPANHNSYMIVLGTSEGWAGPGFNFYFRGPGSQGQQFAFNINGSAIRYGTFEDDKWYHVIGTYDGSRMRLYIDGQYRTFISKSGTIVNSAPLTIGDIPEMDNFNGTIDEIRIYDRALSDAEVTEHYNKTYNDETGLVGLWHFDDATGTIASDNSGFGNDGDIYVADWVEIGLQSGREYNWQAEAFSEGSGSTLSNTTTPVIMPPCAPTKPMLFLTPDCVGATSSVVVSWTFSINATEYIIYRDEVLVKNITQSDPEFFTRTWTDTNEGAGLTPGNSYTYWIIVLGQTGLSNESDHLAIVAVSCDLPSVPQNFSGFSTCVDRYPEIHLSWDESTNTEYYEVFKNGESVSTTVATSFIDIYVGTGQSHSYYVIAHNYAGSSASSTEEVIATWYCQVSTPLVNLVTFCDSIPINEVYWQDE
ncbi:MAG: LamG domain-containing protein, partial [Nanoarchaeota archaeon]|nr:LamG domain-containing protein [Nanoarchaeota archaeon]